MKLIFFLIKHDVECICSMEKNCTFHSLNINKVVHYIALNYPYFNRSFGKDHVIIAPFDFGALGCDMGNTEPSRGILENVTLIQNIGHQSCMRIEQDIVVPQFNLFKNIGSSKKSNES